MNLIVDRLRSSLAVRTAIAFGQSQASNYGAGLAFHAFLTMFPLILGVLSIVGVAVHDPATLSRFQTALLGVLPPDFEGQGEVLKALNGVKRNAGLLGIVSIAGLLWTGTGFFAAIEFAFAQVFGGKQRDLLRQRAMGVLMMVALLTAVVAAVGANAAAALLPGTFIVGPVVAAVVVFSLLVAVYRFVPNQTYALRDIWPGALLAAVVLEILTLVFPLYSGISHGFNTFGNVFALFFVLATWLYLISQTLLLGAVFIRLRVGAPGLPGLLATPPAKARQIPPVSDVVRREKDRADA